MTDDTTPNHAPRDDTVHAGTLNPATRDDALHDDTQESAKRNDAPPDGTLQAAAPSAPAAGPKPAPAAEGTARYRPPLISVLEIENFKGIGAPVRIELRPITLLFGQNSAGKSTVLHALCYARELLTNGNADCRRTGPGGDRIDLGGFRQFVHRHDEDREVRLRFELNLTDWNGHAPLHERVPPEFYDGELRATLEDVGARVTSGWVELRAALRDSRPTLVSYEVGVNDLLVGRLESGPDLAFNPEHPLLAVQRHHGTSTDSRARSAKSGSTSRDGAAGSGSALVAETVAPRVSHVRVWLGSDSPLPRRTEFLHLDQAELRRAGYDGSVHMELKARLTTLLVGVGHTLRDELAGLRYIGPVRNLRPPRRDEPRESDSGGWADGSAAWMRLRDSANPQLADSPNPRLIESVSDWLEHRLDTGYALRSRSVVMLDEEEAPLAAALRTYGQLRRDFGRTDGSVDLDRWLQERARRLADVANRGFPGSSDPTQAGDFEAAVRATARGDDLPDDDAHDSLVDVVAAEYCRLSALIEKVEKRDFCDDEIAQLAHGLARHTPPREPQLVQAEIGLPVRVSNVGVGISQLLPVVVAALDPDRPGITGIEQPELHAHPRLQVELGDLFAQAASDGRVFLLENHSEHLMLRLLRRIEETHQGRLPEGKPELRPDQVSVVYLHLVDGQVQAKRLRIDETGEFLDRWPHGFFEERDDELF